MESLITYLPVKNKYNLMVEVKGLLCFKLLVQKSELFGMRDVGNGVKVSRLGFF